MTMAPRPERAAGIRAGRKAEPVGEGEAGKTALLEQQVQRRGMDFPRQKVQPAAHCILVAHQRDRVPYRVAAGQGIDPPAGRGLVGPARERCEGDVAPAPA